VAAMHTVLKFIKLARSLYSLITPANKPFLTDRGGWTLEIIQHVFNIYTVSMGKPPCNEPTGQNCWYTVAAILF